MKYILALDQGTTSSRAIVFDKNGDIVGSAMSEFPQIYPKSGYVEHNPKEILGTQIGVIGKALIMANVNIKDILSIGITNQRETVVVWNKETGDAIYNAIVWQCRRTAEYCDELKKLGYEKIIHEKTGLVLDAYFSATKIKWILDNVEGARTLANRGLLLCGTIDAYLLWNLSNRTIFKTDYTNASRTMLFNINTLEWDDELLELFDIPKSMLPTVCPSSCLYGYTDPSIIGATIPICGVVGDQQGALFGQLCLSKGSIKTTYGTGCFMLMNTGKNKVNSKNGLITTLTASINEKPNFALEGSVFVGGAVVKWLRDELKLIRESRETEFYAKQVEDTNGVYVVPAFVGLGAPYWNSDARGIITGLTRGTTKEHLIRASLEAVAYQVEDVINAMQSDLGITVSELSVDGGASANDFLMQFQSDISNCCIIRPKVIEVTALGACYLAGLQMKYWSSVDEILENRKVDRTFTPNMGVDKRKQLMDGWHAAVKRAL